MNKDEFALYLADDGLKPTTINNHIRNLSKYKNLDFFELSISQDNIVLTLKEAKINNSQRLTLASTMSKYLQFTNEPNDKLIEYIKSINTDLKKEYAGRNKAKKYEYSKKDILKEINKYYKEQNYRAFVVSYLVYYFNTRNADLNITICKSKRYAKDENQNYLIIRKASVIYIRNDYKTSKTYGSKSHEIRGKKFVESVKNILQDETCIKIFESFSNSTHMITQLMPFGLKTSDIVKIVLAEDNSLHKASKIGKKRGTSLQTLENAYNLKV